MARAAKRRKLNKPSATLGIKAYSTEDNEAKKKTTAVGAKVPTRQSKRLLGTRRATGAQPDVNQKSEERARAVKVYTLFDEDHYNVLHPPDGTVNRARQVFKLDPPPKRTPYHNYDPKLMRKTPLPMLCAVESYQALLHTVAEKIEQCLNRKWTAIQHNYDNFKYPWQESIHLSFYPDLLSSNAVLKLWDHIAAAPAFYAIESLDAVEREMKVWTIALLRDPTRPDVRDTWFTFPRRALIHGEITSA